MGSSLTLPTGPGSVTTSHRSSPTNTLKALVLFCQTKTHSSTQKSEVQGVETESVASGMTHAGNMCRVEAFPSRVEELSITSVKHKCNAAQESQGQFFLHLLTSNGHIKQLVEQPTPRLPNSNVVRAGAFVCRLYSCQQPRPLISDHGPRQQYMCVQFARKRKYGKSITSVLSCRYATNNEPACLQCDPFQPVILALLDTGPHQ